MIKDFEHFAYLKSSAASNPGALKPERLTFIRSFPQKTISFMAQAAALIALTLFSNRGGDPSKK